MPTGFEMDQLAVQKSIAMNLAKVATELAKLNQKLEVFLTFKEMEFNK